MNTIEGWKVTVNDGPHDSWPSRGKLVETWAAHEDVYETPLSKFRVDTEHDAIPVLVVKYYNDPKWYITPQQTTDDDLMAEDLGPFDTMEQAISVVMLGSE